MHDTKQLIAAMSIIDQPVVVSRKERIVFMNPGAIMEIEVDDQPIKWCSVSLSDVVSRGKRLEAVTWFMFGKRFAQQLTTHWIQLLNFCLF